MWLSHTKAKGNIYLYLAVYDSENYKKEKRRERHIFSFGRIDKAVMLLHSWKKNPENIPEEIQELGCNKVTVSSWINKLRERNLIEN
ncbi:hypothetical protein CHH49_18085 [Terribacillus saccharophilus]|nr:hypothetical protein CHH49_18085 [Terribacillus saccharophilus]